MFVDYLVAKCKTKLSEADAKDFVEQLGPNFRLYHDLVIGNPNKISKVEGAHIVYSFTI